MKEIFPFLWCFLPASLAKNTREKKSSALPKAKKRCLRKSYSIGKHTTRAMATLPCNDMEHFHGCNDDRISDGLRWA